MLCFVAVTFAIQALSHFLVNVEHYASIPFMREEPIMALGILAMLIQGLVLSYLYSGYSQKEGSDWKKGIKFGLLTGLFLVSYIALVEPSKFNAPSVASWIIIEGLVGIVQFGVFGLLLGIVFKNKLKTNHP